jgi:hypothetical protein
VNNEVSKKEKTQFRDYDMEPIVIEDRMPEISFIYFIFLTLIPLSIILLWMHLGEKKIDWTHVAISLSILYLPTYYFLKSRIANFRTISIDNTSITRNWDDNAFKIKWTDIKNMKKSFIDFYDNNQKIDETRKKIFFWLYSPVYILVGHPYLIFIKYFYKVAKGFSNKSLFDTIVIFDKNEEMIAIFIATLYEKEELREYFSQKGFDIDNLSIFYTTHYAIDELTYYMKDK